MHDIEHVGAQARQLAQQRRQRAGPVGDPAPEHQVPPGRGQAVPQHLGQQQRIDVAARQHRHHRRLERLRMLQQRRHPRRASRLDDLLGPLQAEQQGTRQGLLRNGLVVLEVALSMMLLVGAGLMIRTLIAMQSMDLGMRPERILTMRIPLSKLPSPNLLNGTLVSVTQAPTMIPVSNRR